MQKLILTVIRIYSYIISPLTGPCCRFYPSCSSYAEQAIRKYGIVRGVLMTAKRIVKCHPWHPGGYDPV